MLIEKQIHLDFLPHQTCQPSSNTDIQQHEEIARDDGNENDANFIVHDARSRSHRQVEMKGVSPRRKECTAQRKNKPSSFRGQPHPDGWSATWITIHLEFN